MGDWKSSMCVIDEKKVACLFFNSSSFVFNAFTSIALVAVNPDVACLPSPKPFLFFRLSLSFPDT